jgi:hypothetical protein
MVKHGRSSEGIRRLRKLAVLALCAAGAGITATVAHSADTHKAGRRVAFAAETTVAPRWYVLKSGNLVGYDEKKGLDELSKPEMLNIAGEVQVHNEEQLSKRPPWSNCLMKGYASITDPAEASLAGSAELQELEISCEKATGQLNGGQPFPCTLVGEAFELKAVGGPWPATLEDTGIKRDIGIDRFNLNFPKIELEVLCLKSRAHGIYVGALKPEVSLGRYNLWQTSGELEEPASGHHLFLRGKDWITVPRYKNVRVNHGGL